MKDDIFDKLKKIRCEFIGILQMEHLQYLENIEAETGINSQNVIEYLMEKDVPDKLATLVHKMMFEYECRLRKKDERTKMIDDFYIDSWEIFNSTNK